MRHTPRHPCTGKSCPIRAIGTDHEQAKQAISGYYSMSYRAAKETRALANTILDGRVMPAGCFAQFVRSIIPVKADIASYLPSNRLSSWQRFAKDPMLADAV